MRIRLLFLLSFASALAAACGSNQPAAPSPPVTPTPTVSELRIGIAGNLQAIVEPGKTIQLFAQAVMSDGTVQDVTNVALWQSGNPVIAVVSPTGLVTTYVAGDVAITATMGKSGSLNLQVKRQCVYTLSPSATDVDAFGRTVHINVIASLASCNWAAQSDAAWLRLTGTPHATGNGAFDIDIAGNSTTTPRAADVVVSGDGGSVQHHVTQGRPANCSYVVDPEETALSAGGGTGSFRVDATPDDCRWKVVTNGVYPINMPDYYSAITTGDFTLQWRVYPGAPGTVYTISICGLSGANPCGIFTVRLR